MAFVWFAVLAVFAFLRRVLRVQSPRILQDLALAVAMVTLLVFLFARNQVDVTGIVATSAVVTAVIGFALQDTLQNLVGGLALQLDGSISVATGSFTARSRASSGRSRGGTHPSRHATATRTSCPTPFSSRTR
jgi:hypothetical protein